MSEDSTGVGGRRFNSATDAEILNADVADSYFHRTMEILRARGLADTPVHAELAYKTSDPDDWFVVAGLDEIAYLLDGVDVEVRAVPEGTICRPQEPILTLSGPYSAFGEHETAILGLLCQASGVATGAARCRLAAGERPVISFGARRMHPAVTPMIERAAYLGGCDMVAVDLAVERLGIPATGTTPHALVLVLGSTAEAASAFDEVMAPEVPRTIIIDTFDDEKFGALLAARAIPDSISAIRMDTPGNRRGDFLDLMREVRWELDRNGFEHVKIFASGGIDVEYILHLNPICDAYGVGGAIADAPMIDYSLDIVEVDGEDRSKRGKRGGRKRLLELEDGGREILPETTPAPEGATDVLSPLQDLYSPPPETGALRQRVLDQLGTGDFEL
ncbi:MAG: nicotinate phosphoribosyltransferase [Actinomycetota bacterium]|nr:nicotinate phosphoribosyltransferase [Rubrobacteraceae bacterium]MDQ3183253.1 nicotinate phosphoribosyltransferase [Actinomycetota bacterium]MDQ3436156.1 nicotinate phosphoribosyltransferase [Actinomycetota bacterium]